MTKRVLIAILVFVGALGFSLATGLLVLALAVTAGGETSLDIHQNERIFYFLVAWIGFALIASVSYFFLTWESRSATWRRRGIYFFALSVLIGISFMNFAAVVDEPLTYIAQAVIDILMVFLGSLAVMQISRVRTTSDETTVLKFMSLAFLWTFAIVAPALLFCFWLMNRLGWVSEKVLDNVSLTAVASLAAVVSAIVNVLKYRHDTKQQATIP